ncbi:Hypothetical predicted protein [Olea europaea subsp. europaea]|uniref:Replication protein A OB domain-containing protein n=1 Tax=Olea europaea subsp. europaea TaxID=158383 RepID=A0A8S0SHA8_OLEEU|nr:Hypothetical predicted protein [Olea europaea subsp. europaea]
MVLMDLKGNKVHTTLYDGNIIAFEDQLLLSKTYIISNALVKDTKPEYRASNGDMQWTISRKTRIQEVDENNMEFLFSTYTFTPFDELERYMDCNNDISILAIAIDMRPKRLIQTRSRNQTYVQDILLIDMSFHTIILTMWDSYVEKECIFLADNIAKKPVILANQLKVSSFNGLTLSTKINSTFFIDAAFNRVAELRAWVETHFEKLNEIALEKPCLIVTPTKLSPPAHKKFTQIQNIKGRLLGRKYSGSRPKQPSEQQSKISETDPSIVEFIQINPKEHIFYVKVTQLEPNTAEYKYEIIFVLNAFSTIAGGTEQPSREEKGFLCPGEKDDNDIQEMSPPSAKRSLFQTSNELVLPSIKAKTKISTSSSENSHISEKGKLD